MAIIVKGIQFLLYMSELKESATLKAARIVKERIREGLPVYNAGLGENPFKQSWALIYQLIKNAKNKKYLSASGMDELSEKIKDYYSNDNYKVDNTLVLNGLKEMIFMLFLAFEGSIYLLTPHWVSYSQQLKILNKSYIPIKTKVENNYKVTAEDLYLPFSNGYGKKLLILNNPNNPTGVVYTKEELKSIADICRKQKVIVFADEIYLDLVYEGVETYSFSNFYENTIVGCSLSKGYSCGGYRLGWMTFPKSLNELYGKMFSLSSSIISCASHPLQYVALKALERPEELNVHIIFQKKIFKYICVYVRERFIKLNIITSEPGAAWYIFLDFVEYKDKLLERDIKNSAELCERLINEIGLVTVPGSSFGYNGLTLRYSFVDINKDLTNLEKYDLENIMKPELINNIRKGIDCLEYWLR